MQIKDLAQSTNISISAIRYYEKVGLIHPQKKGYYKIYTKEIQEQLLAIKMLQAAGFNLKDLQMLFSFPDKDPSQLEQKELKQILDLLEEKLKEIYQQEKLLSQSKQMLENMKKKVGICYEASK